MTCDLCGRESKANHSDDWGEGNFDIAETEVRLKVGDSYPEGGAGTEIEFDICPKCFRERLIPWLESQGTKVEEKGWDW
jgi:hypothetical protein